MKYLYITFFLLIAMLCSKQSNGQTDTTSIATEKVEVVKNYEAIIQQAKRKKLDLPMPDIDKKSISFDYTLRSEAQLDFDRPKELIRPISYKPERTIQDIKDGNFYASFGNFRTLGLGGAYHYYIEDWLDLGFKADHFSARDNALPFQKFNTTSGKVYGSYFLSKQIKTGAEFRYKGFDHFSPVTIAEDSIAATEQSFQSFGGAVRFSSNFFESAGFSLRGKLDYDLLKQTVDDTKESLFKAEINVLKGLSDRLAFELPLEFRNYRLTLDSATDNSVRDILLRPQLRFREALYSAKAGIEFIRADSTNFIFPLIDLRLEDIYGGISVRAYTSSDFHRNSMHFLSSVNPYYQTRTTLLDVNYLRSYNLELSRDWQNWRFSLRGSYHNFKGDDMHIDRANINRAVVTSLDRKAWEINPTVSYSDKWVDMKLSYHLNLFLGNTKDNLFYRPGSLLNFEIRESLLGSRIKLFQEINYLAERNTAHPSDEDGILDSAWDLSLGVDIQVVKNISVYARASNVLNADYALWYNHPVFERQLWAGLRFNL